jgi:hypothetical protein
MHLFEWMDQPWFPGPIRDLMTELLENRLRQGGHYRLVAGSLAELVGRTGAPRVIDLCAGAGGPWIAIQHMMRELDFDVSIVLTDKFPNRNRIEQLERAENERVSYDRRSIDATDVPADLHGLRTMVNAFHHFRPGAARKILEDAARKNEPICVIEFLERTWPKVLASPLSTLLALAQDITRLRPTRFKGPFWVLLVPFAALFMMWDATVSRLRVYTPDELRQLVAPIPGGDRYTWEIGQREQTSPSRGKMTYVIGYPAATEAP